MSCSTDRDVQNEFFEGYTQNVEVTNLFVSDFKGQIIQAGSNFPGSWHDSCVAMESGLYRPHLFHQTPTGFALLGDNAFPPASKDLCGKILRARKSGKGTPVLSLGTHTLLLWISC